MHNTKSSPKSSTTTTTTIDVDTLATVSGGMRPTPVRPLYVTEIRTKHGLRGF